MPNAADPALPPEINAPRNRCAVVGFAISVITLMCSPFVSVEAIYEVAESEPPYGDVLANAVFIALIALPYPALVILYIGRRRAKPQGAPHGRLALAGQWLLGFSVLVAGIGVSTRSSHSLNLHFDGRGSRCCASTRPRRGWWREQRPRSRCRGDGPTRTV